MYYAEYPGGTIHPLRTWCFFAEIVDDSLAHVRGGRGWGWWCIGCVLLWCLAVAGSAVLACASQVCHPLQCHTARQLHRCMSSSTAWRCATLLGRLPASCLATRRGPSTSASCALAPRAVRRQVLLQRPEHAGERGTRRAGHAVWSATPAAPVLAHVLSGPCSATAVSMCLSKGGPTVCVHCKPACRC